MTKEDLKKQIEILVKDDEISQQTIINQKQEIERLQNIIKEVREYIETEYLSELDDFEKPFILTDKSDWNKVLEILDKENK